MQALIFELSNLLSCAFSSNSLLITNSSLDRRREKTEKEKMLKSTAVFVSDYICSIFENCLFLF